MDNVVQAADESGLPNDRDMALWYQVFRQKNIIQKNTSTEQNVTFKAVFAKGLVEATVGQLVFCQP